MKPQLKILGPSMQNEGETVHVSHYTDSAANPPNFFSFGSRWHTVLLTEEQAEQAVEFIRAELARRASNEHESDTASNQHVG